MKNNFSKIHDSVFIASNACVEGTVVIGEGSSVWYSATVRGDLDSVQIGKNSNIQDAAVVHVDMNFPCKIGDTVTVGHGAIVHGCTIGNSCIVGMGAIIMNGAKIGEESIVGAGALVTQGKEFPPRSMIVGSPAAAKRQLTEEEISHIYKNAEEYVEIAKKQKNTDISKNS